MINQEKLATMVRLALYDKKKSRKDMEICSYEPKDYIRFQGLKTGVFVTIAFVILIGFAALWNLDTMIEHLHVLNVERILLALLAIYGCFLVFYLVLSYRISKEECNQAHPRVRRYIRGLKTLKGIYTEEDRTQRQFEKGEWRNGQ